MDKDYEIYKDFDMTGAKRGIPSHIAQLQVQSKAHHTLDDDVMAWLSVQDEVTKRHINDVIRHFMAVKMA